MIKNIIFDVGMVLVDFSWKKVFEELGFTGETFEEVADATVRSDLWNEYDRSRMSDEEILNGFIANAPHQEANIRLFWEHLAETISCFPYSHEWIREFKDKGYRCYILSNYARRTYEITKEELSFERLMDGVLFSYQVQMVKPDREIFETLLERFSLKAEECVFLDDNVRNVAAARELGIHTIHFTTREAAIEELKVLGVETKGQEEEVLEISKRLLVQNKEAYEELAK